MTDSTAFDVRSRTPADISVVDPIAFHDDVLRTATDARRSLARRAFVAADMTSFTVGVDDSCWTWHLDTDGQVAIDEGDHATGPRVDLDAEWFSDIVNDVRTSVALMIADQPVMTRGRIGHLIRFETVVRAVLDGRVPYEDGAVTFVDRNGDPLDLGRSFTLDDDPDDLAHFLQQAGFLVVRGVCDEGQMDALSAEMTTWFDRMTPDDDRSWFARVGDHDECVRVTNLAISDLDFSFDEHLAPIAATAGNAHRYRGSDLLVKPVGVTEGLSDLPWHKDCELGLHSYRCASLTCGLSVTPSGADNGQLGVIAGSHRVNVTMFDLDRVDLPQVFLSTDRGDVTVHLSCALHCATPPVHTERRVAYSSFRLDGDTAELDRLISSVRDQAGRETYAPT